MGTPDFAVPCLKMLNNENYNVVGVVTQTDKPKGRGKKLTAPPVKVFAKANRINVYQPEKLKPAFFENTLKKINPDLIIVVAYGKILPKYILDYPKYGCINVHASLLPKYRGAGPIQWAIINGERETGITTMFMTEKLDAGDIILRRKVEITEDDTAGTMHDKLADLGADVLRDTLKMLKSGNIIRVRQNDKEATYAPMLDKTTAKIDWNKDAYSLYNLIRGVNPWPVAYTELNGEILKIWKADIGEECYNSDVPGTVLRYDKELGLVVKTGEDETLYVKEIQIQGKKKMSIHEFIKGNKIESGEILG